MNNFERIKNMTVDEMAEYFLLNYEKVKLFKGRFCGFYFLKQWLLQEVENE